MYINYLITAAPDSHRLYDASIRLRQDIDSGFDIGQLFFYSDAVAIGAREDYPAPAQQLLELTEQHDIPITICSAGFQLRQLTLSDLARQDFTFKGLGQFVAESQRADAIRHY